MTMPLQKEIDCFNHRVVTMVADKAKDTVVMYYIICCLQKTIGEDYLTTSILPLVTTEHLCEGVTLACV